MVRWLGQGNAGVGGKTWGNVLGRIGSRSLIRPLFASFEFLTWHMF